MLRHAGARCCTVTVTPTQEAGDGQQAVDLVRALGPDVVLMDVDMPGMDGITATELICARQEPAPRILMVTTFGRPGFLRRALRAARAGGTAADVAREVQVSEGTVRTTSRPAIGKMGARTRADAVPTADENGWL